MSNHKLAYLRVIPSSPSSAAAKSQQCYFIFVKLHSFLKILYVALKCVTSQENKRVVVRGGLYYVRWRGSSACAGVWLWNSQNCSSVTEGLWFDAKAVVKDSVTDTLTNVISLQLKSKINFFCQECFSEARASCAKLLAQTCVNVWDVPLTWRTSDVNAQ